MILGLLTTHPKRLRLCPNFNEVVGHPSTPPALVKVVYTAQNDDIIGVFPSEDVNAFPVYFLPWGGDAGYNITLPSAPGNRKIFITAELTGCSVGVQRLGNGDVIVRHYNTADESDLGVDDFERYGDTLWLLPEKCRRIIPQGNNHFRHYYGGYVTEQGYDPTVFWGEFTGNRWNFYYQTPDKVIHAFQ